MSLQLPDHLSAHLGTPILKWVGGKRRMAAHIARHFDADVHDRIVEPFFGAGAVTFHIAAQHPDVHVVSNDALEPLMGIYRAVVDDVEGFLDQVGRYADAYLALPDKPARKRFYYDLRQQYMERQIDGPAPLFFMLWTAYSGMYRTGKTYPGRFNTPFGFGREKRDWYQPDRVRAAAALMADWTITADDFADTLGHVDDRTFVFLDPPYRDSHTNYTDAAFDLAAQERVCEYANAAAATGATVVYTNRATDDGWYGDRLDGFAFTRVGVRHQVNRNAGTVGRPQIGELVAVANSPAATEDDEAEETSDGDAPETAT